MKSVLSVALVLFFATAPANAASCGAYLRGMTAAVEEGQLHLHRSVFGLKKESPRRDEK